MKQGSGTSCILTTWDVSAEESQPGGRPLDPASPKGTGFRVQAQPLTAGSLRVVAHEALPGSCRLTEAKHVKEPHFLQVELHLVQVLLQEHRAQRIQVTCCCTAS